MTIGVRDLKNSLSRYLNRVKRGEQIIVTERGLPIALLKSIDVVEPSDTSEARLARAAAQGVLTLPTRRLSKKFKPVKASGPAASSMILEDRR